MPPVELSLFALQQQQQQWKRQRCKRTHTHTGYHPHRCTDTREVHSLLKCYTRFTQVDRAQPTHSQLRHELFRYPFARRFLRCCCYCCRVAFVFRARVTSDDSWRSHALYRGSALLLLLLLRYQFDLIQAAATTTRRATAAAKGLAQFTFTWPRVSGAQLKDASLCDCVCVSVRGRALRNSPQAFLLLSVVVLLRCAADTCSVCWRKLFAITHRQGLPDCWKCAYIHSMFILKLLFGFFTIIIQLK